MNIKAKTPNSGNLTYTISFNTTDEVIIFITENKLINNLKSVSQYIRKKIEHIISSDRNVPMYMFKREIRRAFASNIKTTQYWIDRGHSVDEATKHISAHQKEQLDKLCKKRKEDPKFSKQCSPKSIEYWIKKGFSEKEASQKISKSQNTFSLEKCVSKYGQENGLERWNIRQEKWLSTLASKSKEELTDINQRKGVNKQRLIEKYGVEKANEICKSKAVTYDRMLNCYGKERADEWLQAMKCRNNLSPKKISTVSIKFIDDLLKFEFKDKDYVLHGCAELCLTNPDKKFYLFDFAIDLQYNKKIIEFHGDYIHMNPEKYDKSYFNKLQKITAEEKWKRDKHKQCIAEKAGFSYHIVWESDYKNHKTRTIQRCLDFLNE